jgi:glucuronate isomerase
VPPLPEMLDSVFGASLLDWLGPLLVAAVAALSLLLLRRVSGESSGLPAGRYLSLAGSSSAAATAARLLREVSASPLLCGSSGVPASLFARAAAGGAGEWWPGGPAQLALDGDARLLPLLSRLGANGTEAALLAAKEAPEAAWLALAAASRAIGGTPSAVLLRETLFAAFNVTEPLLAFTARKEYARLAAELRSPPFSPPGVALLDRLGLATLACPLAGGQELSAHAALAARSAFRGRIVPLFSPDDLATAAGSAAWSAAVAQLVGSDSEGYAAFLAALQSKRAAVKALGGRATEHRLSHAASLACSLDSARCATLFAAAQRAAVALPSARSAEFELCFFLENVRLSQSDGLVARLFAPADSPSPFDWSNVVEHTQAAAVAAAHGGALTPVELFSTSQADVAILGWLVAASPRGSLLLGTPLYAQRSPDAIVRFLDAAVEAVGVGGLAGFACGAQTAAAAAARGELWRRAVAAWAAGRHAAGLMGWEEARSGFLALSH